MQQDGERSAPYTSLPRPKSSILSGRDEDGHLRREGEKQGVRRRRFW